MLNNVAIEEEVSDADTERDFEKKLGHMKAP
jgi:hypothetical protein